MKNNMKFWKVLGGLAAIIALVSCGAGTASVGESMESIQAKDGIPVVTREVTLGSFVVYRQYPTVLSARSESTAYAMSSDVVRNIQVKVGDWVDRDQVVISFSQDNATYQQAAANFANTEAVFKRVSALYAQSGLSRQDYDNAKTQYDIAKAAYRSASTLVAAKAPISGVISSVAVRKTQNVNPGTELFTVSNADGFESRIYVTFEEIPDIEVGARAFADSRGIRIEGQVTDVSLVMDRTKKAFPVTVLFSGKNTGLASGMSCDVSVEVYRNDQSIVVSRSELKESKTGWLVLVSDQGQAVQRQVVLGRDDGIEFEILSGLVKGDLLITEAKNGLANGDKIAIVDGTDMDVLQ